MGYYHRLLSEKEQAKRTNRIVYLRDKSHLVSGGEQLTWRALGERFGLNPEAVRQAYLRTKK